MNHKEKYAKDGFVVFDGLLDRKSLESLESTIIDRARFDLANLGHDASKLGPYEALRLLEKTSRLRFFKLCTMGTCIGGISIASASAVTSIVGDLFEQDPSRLFCFPPSIFWNDKHVTRLQTKWHQESSYLGEYDSVVTLWTPLFRDLSEDDGPMIVCRGSHENGGKALPYSYSKEEDGVSQFSVSDDIAARYEQVPCAIRRGDAVLFHRSLIHKTGDNRSGMPRASLIVRYFNLFSDPDYEPTLGRNNRTNKEEVAANASLPS